MMLITGFSGCIVCDLCRISAMYCKVTCQHAPQVSLQHCRRIPVPVLDPSLVPACVSVLVSVLVLVLPPVVAACVPCLCHRGIKGVFSQGRGQPPSPPERTKRAVQRRTGEGRCMILAHCRFARHGKPSETK